MKVIGGRGSIRKPDTVASGSVDDTPNRIAYDRSMTSTSICEGDTSITTIPPALIIHPEIIITPEVQSIESGLCTLWVGISITAKLSRADGKPDFVSTMPSFGMETSSLLPTAALHVRYPRFIPSLMRDRHQPW